MQYHPQGNRYICGNCVNLEHEPDSSNRRICSCDGKRHWIGDDARNCDEYAE